MVFSIAPPYKYDLVLPDPPRQGHTLKALPVGLISPNYRQGGYILMTIWFLEYFSRRCLVGEVTGFDQFTMMDGTIPTLYHNIAYCVVGEDAGLHLV